MSAKKKPDMLFDEQFIFFVHNRHFLLVLKSPFLLISAVFLRISVLVFILCDKSAVRITKENKIKPSCTGWRRRDRVFLKFPCSS